MQRLVEANGSAYATEKANLAARLSGPAFNKGTATVAAADLLADVSTLTGAEQYALLYETNSLANRYTYATAKLDRGDKYPDALAVAGGDPRLAGAGRGRDDPADTRTAITYAQAQQAAFNIEGVPAYDNIFIIMEENKSTDAILGNTAYAPYMNQLLAKYNQLTTYYSTGNPSEPNYTALGGGDDFGITDDNWFGCGATRRQRAQGRRLRGRHRLRRPAAGGHRRPAPAGQRAPVRLQHHRRRRVQPDADDRHQPQRAGRQPVHADVQGRPDRRAPTANR